MVVMVSVDSSSVRWHYGGGNLHRSLLRRGLGCKITNVDDGLLDETSVRADQLTLLDQMVAWMDGTSKSSKF